MTGSRQKTAFGTLVVLALITAVAVLRRRARVGNDE